jgi:hypothetical protein
MPPYDDAALVERGVGLENLRVHHMQNIARTSSDNKERGRTHV